MNNQFKYIVFGYGRSIENELHNGNIPFYLLYLCLAYYYQHDDFKNGGNAIKISPNKETAVTVRDSESINSYAYANHWIDCKLNQISKWTLKIDNTQKLDLNTRLGVLFMIKHNRTVILSTEKKISVKRGSEYKIILNTEDSSFEIENVGTFVIPELKESTNENHSTCKLVLNLDGHILSVTMKNHSIKLTKN